MFAKTTFVFLDELAAHNRRDWFEANKTPYKTNIGSSFATNSARTWMRRVSTCISPPTSASSASAARKSALARRQAAIHCSRSSRLR